MPLEVKELIIRALVDPSKSSQSQGANAASSPSEEENADSKWEYKKSLLDQIQKMLQKRKER